MSVIVQAAGDRLLSLVDQSYLWKIKQYLIGELIKIWVGTKRPQREELINSYTASERKINGP